MLSSLLADLRFGARMIRRSPVFSIVCVACIAIGSGAVSTIYSAMNALVLRPLPGTTHGEHLVRMERKRTGGLDGVSASYPLFERLRTRAHSVDAIGAWSKASLTLQPTRDPGVEVYGNFTSANFFEALGVRPALGRFFAPDEARMDAGVPVIVVSERFWRTHLGADTSAIGREIGVNGHRFTLVGVAPAAFEGLDAPIATDAWIPLAMRRQLRPSDGPLVDGNVTVLRLFARLRDGTSIEAAHRELSALTAAFATEGTEPAVYRQYDDLRLSRLTGLPPDASRPLAIFLGLLLGASALVLLIASVNVASMLSARAIARQREMAVRAALGASRARLVRQLLTEIGLLFAIGAIGGVLVAGAATAALERIRVPGSLAFVFELSPDWRVLAFALVVSLATGVLFGLAPSLRAARRDIAQRMREGTAGAGTRRAFAGNALVVSQLAASLVLLIAAGLFLQAMERGSRADPGFDASGVATVAFDPERWGYDAAQGTAFFAALRERVGALPGVTSHAYAMFLPLTMQSQEARARLDGRTDSGADGGVQVSFLAVSDGYFETVRMPIVAGRPIERVDAAQAPKVALVNETFARRHFPDGSVIGRTIGFRGQRVTVVGVTHDAKYSTLTERTPAFVYVPLAQFPERKLALLVRTVGDPAALAPSIAEIVRELDPALPRPRVSTLRHENGFVLVPQRVASLVTGVLGVVGLLLATIGLYGVIAYSTARRTREIGIRLALGADRRDVLRMVVGDGMRLTGIGIAVGVVAALGLTRLIARYLFGVSPFDGATFGGTAALLTAVATFAAYLPARRAAGTNPMRVLRGE